MAKRFPLYLDQTQIDELASMLMRLQTFLNLASDDHTAPDRPLRYLTILRRQCCDRSGASDPYPEIPHVPGIFEGSSGDYRSRSVNDRQARGVN